MSAILQAEPHQIAGLRDRAEGRCIAFTDEPLPPGASQATGRVGVEIDPNSGRTLLHVDRAVRYTGPIPEVAAWFASGTRTFATYDDLQAWIAGPLAQAYDTGAPDSGNGDLLRGETPDREALEPVFVDSVDIMTALAAEVVGQTTPIIQLSDATALHLARRNPRRPLTVLALGPTGVGKTLAAETLAESLTTITGQGCEYLRLDMTEFQERHTVSRLFGAPPGYMGYGESSAIVDVLRVGRWCVVLVDEIEKAHAEVFIALMNLFDAGRLTTAAGETIDARHAVFMLTTNLAVDSVTDALDTEPNVRDDQVALDALVRRTLREHGIAPELVGRLDRLMLFEHLSDEHLDEVLRRTIRREAATFGLRSTSVEDDVLAHLRNRAPDPGSGVRAWEYLVSATLGPAFAETARSGHEGDVTVHANPLRACPV
jgi:AAA domain (Cdc48 subfamily)